MIDYGFKIWDCRWIYDLRMMDDRELFQDMMFVPLSDDGFDDLDWSVWPSEEFHWDISALGIFYGFRSFMDIGWWMTCHILEFDGFQSPCDFYGDSIVRRLDYNSTFWSIVWICNNINDLPGLLHTGFYGH